MPVSSSSSRRAACSGNIPPPHAAARKIPTRAIGWPQQQNGRAYMNRDQRALIGRAPDPPPETRYRIAQAIDGSPRKILN